MQSLDFGGGVSNVAVNVDGRCDTMIEGMTEATATGVRSRPQAEILNEAAELNDWQKTVMLMKCDVSIDKSGCGITSARTSAEFGSSNGSDQSNAYFNDPDADSSTYRFISSDGAQESERQQNCDRTDALNPLVVV